MRKKSNHTAKPSKLTRFRTFQEMKSTPPAFATTKPLDHLKTEYGELVTNLRSEKSVSARQPKKSKKKSSK